MKKRFIIPGVFALIALIVVVVLVLPRNWSKISFEAVVRENAMEQDGNISLTVEKITKFYGDPLCALHITESTKILDENSGKISIRDIHTGYTIMVSLKNSSVEGDPTYYPTVYEIKVIRRD